MAHKTLIDGTEYDVSGGKCLVDSTAYDIAGGKTLVGGTVYDIEFGSAPVVEIPCYLREAFGGSYRYAYTNTNYGYLTWWAANQGMYSTFYAEDIDGTNFYIYTYINGNAYYVRNNRTDMFLITTDKSLAGVFYVSTMATSSYTGICTNINGTKYTFRDNGWSSGEKIKTNTTGSIYMDGYKLDPQ